MSIWPAPAVDAYGNCSFYTVCPLTNVTGGSFAPPTLTGNFASGATTITGLSANPITAGWLQGQTVTGTGIAADTPITGLTATTMTLGVATTAAGTGAVLTAGPATVKYTYNLEGEIPYSALAPPGAAGKPLLISDLQLDLRGSQATGMGCTLLEIEAPAHSGVWKMIANLYDNTPGQQTRNSFENPVSLESGDALCVPMQWLAQGPATTFWFPGSSYSRVAGIWLWYRVGP